MCVVDRSDTDSSSDEFIDVKLHKQSATKGKYNITDCLILIFLVITGQHKNTVIRIHCEDTTSGEEPESG